MIDGDITELLNRLATDWHEPRLADGDASGMRFTCTVLKAEQPNGGLGLLPPQLQALWSSITSARLFVDYEYGQWGLALLSLEEAKRETKSEKKYRPAEFCSGDLIVGKFIGDQELLLVRCDSSSPDFGRVMVVLPLDRRRDWYVVAPDLSTFLHRYAAEQGKKYWDVSGTQLGSRG